MIPLKTRILLADDHAVVRHGLRFGSQDSGIRDHLLYKNGTLFTQRLEGSVLLRLDCAS